jgi:hypothetical protein
VANKGGSYKASLAKAAADIKAGKRAMDKEAAADYRVTQGAEAAGVANLRNFVGRAEGTLLGVSRRQVANVAHLTQRAKEVQRQTRARQAASVSRYGTSTGGIASQAFAGARTAASAGVQNVSGERAVAARGANAAKGVAAVARAGATAQAASGDYALNQALQARYTVDAETAFQAQQALDLQKLQFQQQKQLQELQDKADNPNGGGVQGAGTVVAAAQTAAPELMRLLNTPNATSTAAGKYATPREAAQAYMNDLGIEPTSAQGQLISLLAQQLWNSGAGQVRTTIENDPKDLDGDNWVSRPGGVGNSEPDLLAQATKTLYATSYPDVWKKHKADILKVVDTTAASWEVANPTGASPGTDKATGRPIPAGPTNAQTEENATGTAKADSSSVLNRVNTYAKNTVSRTGDNYTDQDVQNIIARVKKETGVTVTADSVRRSLAYYA